MSKKWLEKKTLSSQEVIDIVKKELGRDITRMTVSEWFHRYKLGKKISGTLYIEPKKLQKLLNGDYDA